MGRLDALAALAESRRAKIASVVRELLGCLPDANNEAACWAWCWEELHGEAQDEVKEARKAGEELLRWLDTPEEEGTSPEPNALEQYVARREPLRPGQRYVVAQGAAVNALFAQACDGDAEIQAIRRMTCGDVGRTLGRYAEQAREPGS